MAYKGMDGFSAWVATEGIDVTRAWLALGHGWH